MNLQIFMLISTHSVSIHHFKLITSKNSTLVKKQLFVLGQNYKTLARIYSRYFGSLIRLLLVIKKIIFKNIALSINCNIFVYVF